MRIPYYSLTKFQDFYLISTEVGLAPDEAMTFYHTSAKGWHWSTDSQEAKRFQYALEALAYAFDNCPIQVYRSWLDDGWIEIDFAAAPPVVRILRGKAMTMISLATVYALRKMLIPTPKKEPAE